MSPQPTPFELVTALRATNDQARAVLEEWCGEPIARLVATVAERLGSKDGSNSIKLARRALRWVELYLRTRDPSQYHGLKRKTFVLSVMIAAYRWLDPNDSSSGELEAVLPDDLFVEAVAGRFTPSGEATVAAAGGFHPILRRSKANVLESLSLSGCFLGLEIGDRDQSRWELDDGDELMLATDGLFDQPCGAEERLGRLLSSRCQDQLRSEPRALHEAVVAVLGKVLGQHPQHDDITVVTLRRRGGASGITGISDAGM
jgi:hypothetical protein